MLAHRTVLNNQSNIQILTASSKSVRGAHPQKLKLDEIDEIDPNIYEAALLIPKPSGGIKASVADLFHHAQDLRPDGPGHRARRPGAATRFTSGASLTSWRSALAGIVDDLRTLGGLPGPGLGMPTAFTGSRTLFPKSGRSPGTPGSARCLLPAQPGRLIYKEFDMALHVV